MSFAAQLAVLTVVSLAVLTTFLDYQTHRGLLWGWQTTFGAMLLWLHDHAQIHIHIPHVWSHTLNFGGVFGSVNNRVVAWLQERLDHAEHEYALSVHALEATWHATVISVEWLAHETAATFEWLNHVKLRQILKALALPVLFPLLLAKILRAVVPHIGHGTARTVKVIEHAVPAKIVQVFKFAGAVELPGVLGLPKIRGDITNLWKWRAKADKRLRKLEGVAAAGVFAGLLANALGVSLRCVRRGNLKTAGRQICGMDSSLLGSLLSDGLLIVGAISVVEFAEALLAIEGEAVAILGAGIREFPG